MINRYMWNNNNNNNWQTLYLNERDWIVWISRLKIKLGMLDF